MLPPRESLHVNCWRWRGGGSRQCPQKMSQDILFSFSVCFVWALSTWSQRLSSDSVFITLNLTPGKADTAATCRWVHLRWGAYFIFPPCSFSDSLAVFIFPWGVTKITNLQVCSIKQLGTTTQCRELPQSRSRKAATAAGGRHLVSRLHNTSAPGHRCQGSCRLADRSQALLAH